jgi:hypothetical protein
MGGGRREDKVKSAGAPARYNDMFGGVSNRGKDFTFTPALSRAQTHMLDSTNNNADMFGTELGNFMRSGQMRGTMDDYLSASRNLTVDDLFNNKFRGAAEDLYTRPIFSQYERDERDMANNLNARGLSGGSYDAMMRNQLMRQRDGQLSDARNQSIFASADAYQQLIAQLAQRAQMAQGYGNNLLSMQGGSLNNRAILLDQIYRPLQAWGAIQSGTNPGTQALMAYQGSQPTMFERGYELTKAAVGGLSQGLGAKLAKGG